MEKFNEDLEKFKAEKVAKIKKDLAYFEDKIKENKMLLKVWGC